MTTVEASTLRDEVRIREQTRAVVGGDHVFWLRRPVHFNLGCLDA